ncbi:alkylation response protein AidB-like acyl-CoA dehydrogenase [Variovorax boronicumulans]|uniref:acyl-CoA dehydrogenase family protein n=1 Tax=Variovorax boronicumulans TaxID=436515 RepID=UPI0027877EBB|nr:acyl-CoA dehydrogenase family protein [Variovorax boronicumulans]MDP9916604.1 alkylation response protein AidB-like acyl-CoA dehydrogenase [Variovorax boronicumulans]
MTTLTDQDDTLAMLRDSLARYLDDQHGFEQRLHALAAADDAPPPFWQGLASDLGLLGAALPESQGGLGLGLAAHLALLPTLGGALAAEPYLSTLVIGAGLLQRHPGAQADALLARVVAGQAVLAFAHDEPHSRHARDDVRTTLVREADGRLKLDGRKAVVQAAPWASHVIVTARSDKGVSLLVVPKDTPGAQLRAYRTRDGGRAADIAFDAVRLEADALLGEEGAALPQIEQALDEATLAVCAESIGILRRLMRDTLDYVRQRKQFGVPISSFQVLQHRLADMHMALEQADALTASVGEALAAGADAASRARAVSSAKVAVAKACRAVGQGAVQLHGGMGMTEELAVGHYVRRATLIEGQFGPPAWHLRRVAQLQQQQPLSQH